MPSALVNTKRPRGVSASDAMRVGDPTDRSSGHVWVLCPNRSSLHQTRYARAGSWSQHHRITDYTSLSRPDAYLCSRLEISVWYGNPSASARF